MKILPLTREIAPVETKIAIQVIFVLILSQI